ncbi:MAG: alanine/glycine:cation symporter family protein [Phycisphaerales bacterium]
MNDLVGQMNAGLTAINNVIWHNYVLFVVLAVGVLFTLWSGFAQYRALTHGVSVIRGKYDDKNDPGAINHFQALSTALSATVGLGNIAGVAVAIALGGPGAVFWMWVVGMVGMAIKTTEVTLSMLHRNTDDPDNPHGGPMWVADKGFKKWGLGWVGKVLGVLFCITLIISTVTGGNMFQAWNVGVICETYFRVPQQVIGVILTVLVGLVIIGGIKRIGAVAGRLVPFMCGIYLIAALYVIIVDIERVPAMLGLIVKSAFAPAEASQAFLGGTAGYAFLWGMKRALFSNEAGQGSSPIAHSAAKTDEPVREGIVAGLEPFVDTIVVCTLTTLVVLLSGAWNRGPEAMFDATAVPTIRQVEGSTGEWIAVTGAVPAKSADAARINGPWRERDTVFVLIKADLDPNTGREIRRLTGTIKTDPDNASSLIVEWNPYPSVKTPQVVAEADGRIGLYNDLVGAALTGHAFDRVTPGLGKWIVTIAAWLFALSTMISWSYYGEQGVVYLFGTKLVMPYRLVYCGLIMLSCAGFIRTDAELDNLTALGTGVMLWANIPIMLIFGAAAMTAYHNYIRRLKRGELDSHAAPKFTDVVEGKDVK